MTGKEEEEEKVVVEDWRIGESELVQSEAFSSFDDAQSGKLERVQNSFHHNQILESFCKKKTHFIQHHSHPHHDAGHHNHHQDHHGGFDLLRSNRGTA